MVNPPVYNKGYYKIDAGLKGYIQEGTYNNVVDFPFPKANLAGTCTYETPLVFLKEEASQCIGPLTMDAATCTGVNFNPKYFISPILQLIIHPTDITKRADVTTSDTHYKLNADGTYSTYTGTLESTFDNSGAPNCICQNHVQEIIYTVKYKDDNGFFNPLSVNAQFVL